MKIKVAAPINTKPADSKIFEPLLISQSPSIKIRKLHNHLVTSSGLVVGPKGLVKECYHAAIPDQFNKRSAELTQYRVAILNSTENLIMLDDDETYLVIHHPWHNGYYHWVCETLPRLLMIDDKISDMILLLPSKDQLSDFALQSLQPFKFKKIYYISSWKSAIVKNLCLPALSPVVESFNAQVVRKANHFYRAYFKNNQNSNKNKGDRIYLSRRKSRRREVINENEVIDILRDYNFSIIYNEDYSFFDQVSIYSNAKYLISIHGAGLANMIFMPLGSVVFELQKKQTSLHDDNYNSIFWYLADSLTHKYYYQLCEPTDLNENYYTANIMVDIDLLKKNLELIFGN